MIETARPDERTCSIKGPRMSTFTVPIGVGNIDSREFVYVDALVDTGATYSMFPRDFLENLHMKPS